MRVSSSLSLPASLRICGAWLFGILLSGCAAHQPAHRPGPSTIGRSGATLEVANRTPDPLEIAVAGWTVGSVDSGERARFRALRGGTRRVTAWTARAGKPWTRQLQLKVGGITAWEILPRDGRPPTPVPAAFGSVLLVNRSGRDLDLRFEGDDARTLLDGDTQRLLDIGAGPRSLEVRAPGTRYLRTHSLTVAPGSELRYEVRIDSGELRVTNTTGEAVLFFLDGIELRTVGNAITTTIPGLVVGVHRLRAVGSATGKIHFRSIRMARAQQIRWDLSATQGQLLLRNATGERLTLTIDAKPRGELPNGKTLRIEDAPLGKRRVEALGSSTGHRWSADVPLTAGHEVRWVIRDNTGTLRVHNALQESISVRVGDQLLGKVRPGGQRFFGQLPGGSQSLSAQGAISQVIQVMRAEISSERSVVWRVTKPEGRLHVRNRTGEPVIVYADQRALGGVPRDADVVFTQVPPGERLLEARGQVSGDTKRAKRTLAATEIVVWDVATSTGKIGIRNDSGEALVAPPGLRPQGRTLRPGDRRVYLVPVGHRIVHFLGKSSGHSYFSRFTVTPTKQLEWVVPRLQGLLHVFNRTSERQSILVDRKQRLVVESGKDAKVTLPIGPHRLVAVGDSTRNASESTVVIRSKVTHPWEVRPNLAFVQIVNNSRETLDLRVDGGVLGSVAPNAVAKFGPWPARPVVLTAQGRWSKAIYEARVQLAGGRVESWEIEPARGVVRVYNRRPEGVRILVGGKQVARVPANGEHRLSLPLGTTLVELVGQESHAIFSRRLRIRPDRTYSLDAPRGPARLVVVNRLPVPLELSTSERTLGQVPANGQAGFDLQWLGKRTFLARTPDGKLTWHRRLRIDGDRVFRWEITP